MKDTNLFQQNEINIGYINAIEGNLKSLKK